jgi:plastocyanin
MRWLQRVAITTAVVLAGCSSYGTSPYGGGMSMTSGGRSASITVGNNFYSITPDTVASGTPITWTWSTPSNGHTVNWDSGPGTLPANSGTKTSGTYSTTLTTAGTYHYHCAIHGAAMSGVLVIQ